ncbi:insulinase family protein [Candidatus Dependentiae bacterium]|nr:insulinase family protein [Candidatus Dependentiae bacterium]
MKKFTFFLINLFLIASIVSPSSDAAAILSEDISRGTLAGFAYAEKTLSNGMRIVAVSQPSAPNVILEVVLSGVGSVVERGQERGWAHLLEHMVFKGTAEMSETTYGALESRYGARSNAFTSHDLTSYYLIAPKNNWKPLVKLHAQCLSNAAIDEQHLASEVKVVIKELRRNKDNAMWESYVQLFRECYPEGHPTNSAVIGYKKDLAGVCADALRDFFKKYYQPQFMTFFIWGDIDLDEALEVGTKEMSLMQKGSTVLPTFDSASCEITDNFYKKVESDFEQETVMLAWRLPGGIHDAYRSAELLKELLVGGDSRILEKRLIHDEKCAVSVGVDIDCASLSNHFFINIQPMSGKKEQCVSLIRQELDRLVKNGIKEDFLRAVKNKISLAQASMLDKLTAEMRGIPFAWMHVYALNQDLQDCFDFASTLELVTAEQIANLISSFMIPEKMMRVDLVPRDPENVAAQQESLKAEQVLEEEILRIHNRTRPLEEVIIPAGYADANGLEFTSVEASSKKTFSNGFTVLVKEESSDLAVALLELKKADLKEDTKTAIAFSMLGEWLFSGSAGMTKKEIHDCFDDLGVDLLVDGLSIRLLGTHKNIKQAILKVIEVLKTANCDELSFDAIKSRTIESLKLNKNDALTVAMRMLKSSACSESLYDWTIDDAIDFVRQLTPRDLRNYFCGYFNPSKMALVVVGNVEAQEIFDLVGAEMSVWQSHMILENYDAGSCRAGIFEHQMVKDQVWMWWGRRSDIDLYHPKKAIIDVLSCVFKDRIFQLREQTGLYYVIGGRLGSGFSRSPAIDKMWLQTGPEHVKISAQLIASFLADAAIAPVTAQELAAAKNSLKSSLIGLVSGVESQASWILANECLGLDANYFEKYCAAIDALTPEDATQELKAYLQSGQFMQVRVGLVE